VWLPLTLRSAAIGPDAARAFRRTVWILCGAIAAMVLLAVASVAFDVWDAIETRTDLVTLTGRTEIWDITLRAWRENVLFGYGAGIWGPERQLQFHMFHVGHAHNQVVQTLGEAGLAGLGLLLYYLGTLLVASLRGFVASRGMVLMLLMLMLVLCVTEAPMRGEGLLAWQTFLQLMLVIMACWHVRATHAARLARERLRADAAPRPASPGLALHGS
jgi:O-antigen ligase